MNHIAISCADIESLVPWWHENLGFEIVSPIRSFNRTDHPDAFKYIFASYPESMRAVKLAILTSANGVGLEFFQFVDPPPVPRKESFDFATVGVFHICVTDPDPEALVRRVVAAGGKQLGGYMDYSRYGHEGHKGVYMQDPWGNVVECMSLSLDRVATASRHLAWYLEKAETQRLEQESDRSGLAAKV